MREINHLSIHQWLRSAIPDSQQPNSPIGFLFLKLPPPPCAVLLVEFPNNKYTLSDKNYLGCLLTGGVIRGKGLYMLYTILMNAN